MTEYIALLRGINVGRAKRVPMAELRDLLESLGCTSVRTLLNSGNAVFETKQRSPSRLATSIEKAIETRFGFPVPVIVRSAVELGRIVEENSLVAEAERDPSKFLVAFVSALADLKKLEPLLSQSWLPGKLAVGSLAAYLWCPSGILESELSRAIGPVLGAAVTTRNWATVLKLQAATGR